MDDLLGRDRLARLDPLVAVRSRAALRLTGSGGGGIHACPGRVGDVSGMTLGRGDDIFGDGVDVDRAPSILARLVLTGTNNRLRTQRHRRPTDGDKESVNSDRVARRLPTEPCL